MDNKPKGITFMLISALAFAIIGFIVWLEVPDFLSIMGTSLIIASAIFAHIYNEKKLKINKKTITTSRRSILEL